MKIVFINTHPVQYLAPLYQEMASGQTNFELEVWYCTTHGLNAEVDKQFGRAIQWDVPLLEGYRHRFLKNYALQPSIYSFWGMLNLEIFEGIARLPKRSAIVVLGWNNFSYLAAIVTAKIFGHSVCLRCENTLKKETLRRGVLKRLQRAVLRYAVFPLIDYFLYVGEQNKHFYRQYGVESKKLIFSPYAVDNRRFRSEAAVLTPQKQQLRMSMELPTDKKVVLFTGKFVPVKRVFDLLDAFHQVRELDAVLVLVGDGELKDELLRRIQDLRLDKQVFLPGFANQREIARYYALADVLILCSESETWGLSVNEALNFGLPVLVSDTVGCAEDLVRDGENGFIFPKGNTVQLAKDLRFVLENHAWRETAATASRQIVSRYSYSHTIQNLEALCMH
jgi:glycosyltransferase involved in cell wall biosynthesis